MKKLVSDSLDNHSIHILSKELRDLKKAPGT